MDHGRGRADKRARAEELARRLLDRFAPGGLLHHGQGKWYPGEPLPRWQIALLWRSDGEPLWDDRSLLASPVEAGTGPADAGTGPVDAGTGTVDAGALADAIAGALGLPDGCCIPAYEDPLHLLQVEASLPGGEPPATDVAPADEPWHRAMLDWPRSPRSTRLAGAAPSGG